MQSTVFALSVLARLSGTVLAQETKTVITKINGQEVGAEQVPAPMPDAFNSFEETDANGDGRVTPQEAREAGILDFSQADSNHDGVLNPDEYYRAAGMMNTPRTVQ